jgi:hypothetical protein
VLVGSGSAVSSSVADSSGSGEDSDGEGLGDGLGDADSSRSPASPLTSLRELASCSSVRPALKAWARKLTRPEAASSSKPIR